MNLHVHIEELVLHGFAPGDRAPAFTLTDQHGKKVKLSDFKGKKVVVYFYPRADTPGCTTQSCALRDAEPPPTCSAHRRRGTTAWDATGYPLPRDLRRRTGRAVGGPATAAARRR